MATKKKRKTKSAKKTKKIKKTKKTTKKKAAGSKAGKKTARKPARKKTAPKKSAKPKAAAKPILKIVPAPAPVAPPPGERIGRVTHYYSHLSVAIIDLDSGVLRVGDVVHIKGHTSDFRQRVESMEINHAHVNEARPGDSFGLRVSQHAREHDVVYKVVP